MTRQANIDRFENLLKSMNRTGIDGLLSFLRKSDFYVAPASTHYHSCHEGGLLEHTLNVLDCLMDKSSEIVWSKIICDVDHESIILSALLHDMCKIYYYAPEWRNKKVYSEQGTKRDNGGRFDWQTIQSWKVEDKMPYGHGEKSVMIAEQYIDLKPVERYAIRWHMGFTEPKENWGALSAAIDKYPFILALHEADLEATYLLEKEE